MITALRHLHTETVTAFHVARLRGYGGLHWELLWAMLSLEIAIRDYEHGITSARTAMTAIQRAIRIVDIVEGMATSEQRARAS